MKRLVCLVGALLGGLTLSQIPEYSQQYSQRLGGAIDELAAIIARFDADAAAAGLTREQGVARYAQSPDGFLVDRGVSMQTVFLRHDQLVAQRAALRESGPIGRAATIFAQFDTDVGAAALEDYQPAVPVTAEGVVHAGIGLLVGYGLFWGGWSAAAAPFRRRRNQVKIREKR